MRSIKIILAAAVALVLLSGCYHQRTALGVARLLEYKSDSLEIEIPFQVKGRGNIHNLDLKKYQFASAHWIYASKLQPVIPADSLLLCYERGKTNYSWPQNKLKGRLSIQDSILTIDLQLPYYNNKDVITKWTNYEFNGRYRLTTTP